MFFLLAMKVISTFKNEWENKISIDFQAMYGFLFAQYASFKIMEINPAVATITFKALVIRYLKILFYKSFY
ncbi:hypothetical protein DDD_0761 [Nonlabens dokdonensis DSW-6]|uniref:Uncharacterized protein n=1 Tax=Nonlabens dokdonensis (strain DSM 17205 / KCTC 12402 / DSW-6) TaxID=592029 RepID=L7WAI6_NONDD|nr:hypothetical protein DDD_0761 [Nonlabens dokdonensis DSW-6]